MRSFNGYQRHRQSAPSSEQCVIALRAFSGARLILRKKTKSVETAASCRGSDAALVQAAVTLCAGDLALQARIIRGGFPLAEIPRQARRILVTTPVVVARVA
jgi:hypothetical protein